MVHVHHYPVQGDLSFDMDWDYNCKGVGNFWLSREIDYPTLSATQYAPGLLIGSLNILSETVVLVLIADSQPFQGTP